MDPDSPKATSVTEEGEPDGFAIPTAYWSEADPAGQTRLVITVPPARLAAVHQGLLQVLKPPLGVLYRQVVDRRQPRPQGAPSRDYIALERSQADVLAALQSCSGLAYHDARGEFWFRGQLGEQLVLDGDGLLYAYPDDPSFRDVLAGHDLPEGKVQTMADRDYVKHWFHAPCDAQEDRFVDQLGLSEVGAGPPAG